MPRVSHFIGWGLATLASAFILMLLPYDERGVVALRLNQRLERHSEIQKLIPAQCRQLLPQSEKMLEKRFAAKLAPPPQLQQMQSAQSQPGICTLSVEETHYSRFWLYQNWKLALRISRTDGPHPRTLYSGLHSLSVPLPLCLLPIIAFLLAILFDFPGWKLSWSAALYLLFISGFNLIELVRLLGKSTQLILVSDRVFAGFLLISIWLALYRNIKKENRISRSGSRPLEDGLNQFLSALIGVWNPAFYSLIGPLVYPVGKQLKRLTPFFNGQLILITLSLSLLGLDWNSSRTALLGILLPRYLSFAVIFFLVLSFFPKNPKPQVLLWQLPSFWRQLGFIALGEGLAQFLPWIAAFPGLMRVGFFLILCELSRLPKIKWKDFWREWKRPLGAITFSALISVASTQSGVIDLVISICDPRKHPTAIIPFTLLSGILLGFLSGGLIPPFFIFVSELIRDYPTPLMHACLLDGVLVGLILSPFSLYNLFPAFEFELSIQETILIRWKQLRVPIAVGSLIYLLGTATSVRILQPVTFLFFCMTAIAFKLRTVDWNLERFGIGKEEV